MRTKIDHSGPFSFAMNHGFLALPLLALLASCDPTPREALSTEDNNTLSKVEVSIERVEQKIETPAKSGASPLQSMVLLQATNQEFNQLQPWLKKTPSFQAGFAIYIGNGKFLTAANLIGSNNFLELASPDRSQFTPALVETVDEETNLALLALKNPEEATWTKSLVPIPLGDAPSLNKELELWQFNSEGVPIITKGTLQSTDLQSPYTNKALFTIYDIKSSTDPILANAGIPVTSEGKLVGISLKSNTEKQQVQTLSHPVIRQFLEKAQARPPYIGFPQIGLETDFLVDPVFRKYLKLDPQGGGVFISKVTPRSAAEAASIQQGDVLESINGTPIDTRGLVKDDTLGPVHYSFLLRDTRKQGDTAQLGLKREGKPFEALITLNRDAVEKDIVSRPSEGKQPHYLIEGGIIFQPVTYPLLEAISPKDDNNSSMEMLEALDKKEDYVKQGRREIILITKVLPTQAALGYSSLTGSILQKVNGIIVKDLKHLAELFDQASEEDIIRIETNKIPYVVYLSRKTIKQGNDIIQSNGIPVLRNISQ